MAKMKQGYKKQSTQTNHQSSMSMMAKMQKLGMNHPKMHKEKMKGGKRGM